MTTILAAIFVFGLLIIGHEFGHFTVAKLSGIKVLEFSFGMGPRILKFKKGDTEYSLRIFPIGGFVRMLGEDEQVDDPRSFSCKPVLARMATVAAGPIMNVIISILIFAGIAMAVGYAKPVVKSYPDKPKSNPNIVYPVESAGIRPGDKIVEANGRSVLTYEDFKLFMYQNGGKTFDMTVKRGNQKITKSITPIYISEYNMYMVGIDPVFEKASLFEGLQYGTFNTWSLTKQMFSALGGLITGATSTNDLSGPVGIIRYTGEVAKQGFANLLVFTSLLSINLALMNLIPFPALDGGWVLLLLIEGIRGKKLDPNKVGMLNFVGFAFLILLTVFVTFKDVMKLNIF
mgnify:CR=1 FL=1